MRIKGLDRLWHHPGHLLWILVGYLPFMGAMSVPLTGDQKVYLSTAVEMRETGNWLRPVLFGEPSYYKPPLQYWATLVGWKIFGFNFWGSVVPSVLCALLTALLVGEIARLLHERRPFVNAGLWFAGCLGTVTYASTAQMEIYLVLLYSLSWWAGLRYLADPHGMRRWRWLYLAFAVAGLSSLVKSPLYSVFWVTGYFTYLIISGEWELFRHRHLYLAGVLGVVLASVWYVAVLAVDGPRFWSDYVMRENWDKNSGNGGGPLSIWGALFYFSFPFTLLLFPSLRAIWKRQRRTGDILRFILSWAWPPALFFTLYPYRIKPYLYILVPMLAVAVDWGYVAERRLRLYRGTVILNGALSTVVFVALAIVLFRGELVPVWISAGFACLGVFMLVCSVLDRMRGLALAGIGAVFFFHAAAASLGEQDIADLRDVLSSRPTAQLGFLDENRNIWHEVGLISVGIGRPAARVENLDQATDLIQRGGVLALTGEQAKQHLRTIQAKFLGRGDLRDLGDLPWRRWKVRAQFPYLNLIRFGKQGVADFDGQTHREFRLVFLERKT